MDFLRSRWYGRVPGTCRVPGRGPAASLDGDPPRPWTRTCRGMEERRDLRRIPSLLRPHNAHRRCPWTGTRCGMEERRDLRRIPSLLRPHNAHRRCPWTRTCRGMEERRDLRRIPSLLRPHNAHRRCPWTGTVPFPTIPFPNLWRKHENLLGKRQGFNGSSPYAGKSRSCLRANRSAKCG
ncbi:hypothetical protein Holit_01687 [Hollandina sp. SP2]